MVDGRFTAIRNHDRARQVIRFDDMQLPKNGRVVWPTDIDAVLDWSGKAFVFYEAKHGEAPFPDGQRIMFENLLRLLKAAKAPAMAMVVEHHADDPMEDVMLGACKVRLLMSNNEDFKWREPKEPMTAREMTKSFLEIAGCI